MDADALFVEFFHLSNLWGSLGRVMDRIVLVKGEVEMRGDDSVRYVAPCVGREE